MDLPHVFEPFYRSAQSRRHGIAGSGLGLAVVQRIARALGGRVSVHSEHGQGSTFSLYLTTLPGANGEEWESYAGCLPPVAEPLIGTIGKDG